MLVIRDIENIKNKWKDCILTIGNFDGVHLGHKFLLNFITKQKILYNKPVVLLLFEPQPLELLRPDASPPRLTKLREKIRHLSLWNIDTIICLRFNKHFSLLHPNQFISDILVEKLKVKILIIGNDFRFGKNRMGNVSLLREKGKIYNFHVIVPNTYCKNNKKISSTAIRNALSKNNFSLAQSLLGYPFSISGKVIHGRKKGRKIGFPTANISLSQYISPVTGVFAVKIPKLLTKYIYGIANIGIKPSFSNQLQQLEVHLFDITIDLYTQNIEVILCKKIRDEKTFSSIEELKKQISKDILIVRNYFAIHYKT
ncbi:bifunctional riboflavin kinase/FAD synthetase [Buchnera aphidicola (Formosaphis micheliae)]|uniref:bifunctional riboflavin kinase/FAD synthetase n=1 Tax=Buchnera aphidicola TaxID=9 RepID=UPI0031B82EA4